MQNINIGLLVGNDHEEAKYQQAPEEAKYQQALRPFIRNLSFPFWKIVIVDGSLGLFLAIAHYLGLQPLVLFSWLMQGFFILWPHHLGLQPSVLLPLLIKFLFSGLKKFFIWLNHFGGDTTEFYLHMLEVDLFNQIIIALGWFVIPRILNGYTGVLRRFYQNNGHLPQKRIFLISFAVWGVFLGIQAYWYLRNHPYRVYADGEDGELNLENYFH